MFKKILILLALAFAMGQSLVFAGNMKANKTPVEAALQLSPSAVVKKLKAGHQRFLAQKLQVRDVQADIAATANQQSPYAIVLSCIDSRVPVEQIFDMGIGELFVTRVAGNFSNDDILGSLEFATKVTGSPLILVMGHTGCGAVHGAIDGVELGHITKMLTHLKPAVEKAKARLDDHVEGVVDKNKWAERATIENVYLTINKIKQDSDIIRHLIEQGQLGIIGAIYDVHTGRVEFLEE